MNPGLFGISNVAADNTSKVRVRQPFTADEVGVEAIRLQSLSTHPLTKAITISGGCWPYILAASPTAAVALGTGSSSAATTSAFSTTDGVTWSLRTVTSGIYAQCIWTGTIFFAITTATSATQTAPEAGTPWSVGTVRPNTAASSLRLFNGKVYIFPAAGTTYYESTDSNCTAWTTRAAVANYAAPTTITVTNSRIVINTSATAGISSSDGTTWTTWSIPALTNSSTNRYLVSTSKGCALLVHGNTGNNSQLAFFNSYDDGLTFENQCKILDCYSIVPHNITSGATNGAQTTGPSSAGTSNFSISGSMSSSSHGRVALIIRAQHNSAIRAHLIHSVDCENWYLEPQHADSISDADSGIVAFNNGFILTYGEARSSASAPSASCIITNTKFKELVYDL